MVGLLQRTTNEYLVYSVKPEETRERTTEGMELILKGWTEPYPFGWQGCHYQYRTVSVWPRPLQQPYPPTYALGTSRESCEFAARHHLGLGVSFGPFEVVSPATRYYREQCALYGWEPTPEQMIYRGNILLAESDADAEELPKIGPSYEAGIFREIDRMAAAIPANELAIQWDCTEPPQYETASTDGRRDMIERLVRIGGDVPAGVEWGYHLCYGDFEHRHSREPGDTGTLVEIANAISAGVTRNIDWIHMPVPRSRSDDAYFAPLRHLKLRPETRLYLGLVHYADGLEGARKRLTAAERMVSDFGIATECGFGRRPREQDIRELLRLHAQIAEL